MLSERLKVPLERLRCALDPAELGFETTEEVPPTDGIIGQDRALKAMEFGLQIGLDGYNLYVAGPVGTGKMTSLRRYLSELASKRPTPPDWCYIHNFEQPDNPKAISLPAGMGHELAQDMGTFLERAREEIPRIFQSEDYERRRNDLLRDLETRREEFSRRVQEDARREGFLVQPTPAGLALVPLKDGQPMTAEDFEALPQDARRQLEEHRERIREEMEQFLRANREMEQEARDRIEQLDRETSLLAVGPILDGLRQKYASLPQVLDLLNQVQNDIPHHIGDFRPGEAHRGTEAAPAAFEALLREDHLVRYRVNVLVDNRQTQGAPVVIEYRPTYYNLFGRIDYQARLGGTVTDFTMIKPGAIHRANGGYLVVQAKDIFTSPLSWEALKRTLRSKEAQVENLGEQYSAIPTATLRPEPIPIDVKVVMVGPPVFYQLLYGLDEDFPRLFGVKADFDVEVDRTKESIRQYAGFISAQCQTKGLKPFDKSAVARVVDYASRAAEDQERLSTRFLEMSRLITEADFWASQSGNRHVTAQDVDRAVREKAYRSNLVEEKVQRMILEQTIHISTAGAAPARVNGLSIISLGDYTFGRPSLITARTYLGTQGVVNIEREIRLSGRIHSKGFLILAGYLAGKYAQDKPLAVSGSITFEQVYDEVDGDSAASTELYALLSSLSGLPLKQSIAVTGSVNQQGEVQAVGEVTRKVEGFFEVCKARGLNGEQGVIIPRDNVRNLMLRDEVVEAVKEGKFSVWAVSTIDEGIELLTGVPAGERRPDGAYPEGTVHYLVDKRLREYAQRIKEFRPIEARREGERPEDGHPNGDAQ